MPKKEIPKVDKDDFIKFLSHATPEDLNKLILEKGKPRKLYYPVFFFKNKTEQKLGGTENG